MTKKAPQIRTSYDVYKNKYTFVQSELSEDKKTLTEIWQGPNNEILRSSAVRTERDTWRNSDETLVEENGTVRILERFEPECGFSCYKLENKPDGSTVTTLTDYPKEMGPQTPWYEKLARITVHELSPSGQMTTTITQLNDHHVYDETIIQPDLTKITRSIVCGEKRKETIEKANGEKTVTEWEASISEDGAHILNSDPSRKTFESTSKDGHTSVKMWNKGKLTYSSEEDIKPSVGATAPRQDSVSRAAEGYLLEKWYAEDGREVIAARCTTPSSYFAEGLGEEKNTFWELKEAKFEGNVIKRYRAEYKDGLIQQEEFFDFTGPETVIVKRTYTDKGYTEDCKKGTQHICQKFVGNSKELGDSWRKPHQRDAQYVQQFGSPLKCLPDLRLEWKRVSDENGLEQTVYDADGNVRFTVKQNAKKDITMRYDEQGDLKTIVLKDAQGKAKVKKGVMATLAARKRGLKTNS